MKRCPLCNKTYGEDGLRFCLDDGAVLVGESGDTKSTSPFSKQATSGNRPGTNDPFTPSGWNAQSSQPQSHGSLGSIPSPHAQSSYNPTPYYQRPAEYVPMAAFFLSLTAFLLGLFSITLGWICMGPLVAPIAIILGLAGLIKLKFDWSKCEKKAFPIISIILSLLGMVTGGIVVGLFIILIIASFL